MQVGTLAQQILYALVYSHGGSFCNIYPNVGPLYGCAFI